jgi:hypothetical protein
MSIIQTLMCINQLNVPYELQDEIKDYVFQTVVGHAKKVRAEVNEIVKWSLKSRCDGDERWGFYVLNDIGRPTLYLRAMNCATCGEYVSALNCAIHDKIRCTCGRHPDSMELFYPYNDADTDVDAEDEYDYEETMEPDDQRDYGDEEYW